MIKKCLAYFRYYSWENPELLAKELQDQVTSAGYESIQVVFDKRDSENIELSKIVNNLHDWTDFSFIVPSLDHLDEYVSNASALLHLLSKMFDRNVVFESLEESLSSNEHTHLFINSLVPAIDTAKAKLKSARISQARVAAKMAGEQVGAKKVRDDEKIRELRAKGLSIRQIANELGTSTSPVQAALK